MSGENKVNVKEKKKSGWFQKIPSEILLSPGGVFLVIFALIMEIIDIIPVPFVDQLWEIPMEIIFMILLVAIAKVPLKSLIIPFLIERIPIVSDIVPSWLIRMFI